MGGSASKNEKKIEPSTPSTPPTTVLTVTPVTASGASENYLSRNNNQYLIIAFFAGILLTLLLMCLVFLVIKSYKKCHAQDQALGLHSDSHLDPPVKQRSVPEDDTVTYVSASFKFPEAEASRKSIAAKRSADSEPIIYSQIKVSS